MNEPYQLWGIRQGKLALVRLKGWNSMTGLERGWEKYIKDKTVRSLEARLYMTFTEYHVINDRMKSVELREYKSSNDRDAFILKNAVYFTCVAFLGVGKYDRNEMTTLKEARHLGQRLAEHHKRNYLIYAINKQGNSAYVETIYFSRNNKKG